MVPDPIALLASLVSISSPSRQEAQAAGFLHAWFDQHGLKARRIGNNVVIELSGSQPGRTLLLNSHLDTVPAAKGWVTDPLTPVRSGQQLTGLGAVDAKASVAAMACAVVRSACSLQSGKLVFAATDMEEVGHGGLEQILPQLGPIDAALVGEPTSLQAACAQNGLLLLRATTRGQAAHAARASTGKNALYLAAQDLLTIQQLDLDRVHPLLGASQANVTLIQGGTVHNVIPSRCDYTIDIRYSPLYKSSELIQLVDKITSADITVESQSMVPVETATTAPILQAITATQPDIKVIGSPTMSDWIYLYPIDTIKIGPGDGLHSHSANETIKLADVQNAVDFYVDVIAEYLQH